MTHVNEYDPTLTTLTPAGPTYSVQETVNVGTLVVTLAASDQDDDVDGALLFSIVSTTDGLEN